MRPLRSLVAIQRLRPLVGALVLGAGCQSATVPDLPSDVTAGLTREVVAGVTLSLAATPSTVAPGDTIHLTATARNTTRARLRIGVQCGPAMDVAIMAPGGQRRSALADAVGGGSFTCELGPYHFVGPDSMRVVQIAWVAPAVRGTYVARAGLRRADGLGNLTTPLPLRVQ